VLGDRLSDLPGVKSPPRTCGVRASPDQMQGGVLSHPRGALHSESYLY